NNWLVNLNNIVSYRVEQLSCSTLCPIEDHHINSCISCSNSPPVAHNVASHHTESCRCCSLSHPTDRTIASFAQHLVQRYKMRRQSLIDLVHQRCQSDPHIRRRNR